MRLPLSCAEADGLQSQIREVNVIKAAERQGAYMYYGRVPEGACIIITCHLDISIAVASK